MVRVRPAEPADVDRLVEIHFRVFPDPRGEPARRNRFIANPLGSLEDACVAEEGGVVIGHAFALPLRGWFGGRSVQFTGIASVGVAPERRGRGVATALLHAIHHRALERGDALTMLYAFREGFYERFGYGKARSYRRLRLSPRSVPVGWARGEATRAATGADRASIELVYAGSLPARTGAIERPTPVWTARFQEPRLAFFVVERGSQLVGYVSYELAQVSPHAEVTAHIDDLVALDASAMRCLWGHLGGLRDQVAVIEIDVSEDDPILFALLDIDAHRHGDGRVEHSVGVIGGGPMVRVVDRERALLARGYPADGDLGLVVEGGASVGLSVRDGQPALTSRPIADSLEVSEVALAQIVFGGLAPSAAERLGLARASSREALDRADRLFALPAYLSRDAF